MASTSAGTGQTLHSIDGRGTRVTAEDVHTEFSGSILKWAARQGREFPWRDTTDAYRVLIAEMMLRRTRADEVRRVYSRFVDRYPDARSLAAASEGEVAELLRPLGLAWRVPAFRQMARRLVEEYAGTVPRDRQALMSLPGVGEYVADAVRCIAFNEPVALVDTNTVRVAGRYFGFPFHPDSRRRVPVRRAVARLVDPSAPRDSNLALLDFAAIICRAGRPFCEQCPVAIRCAWRQMELAKSEEVSASSD